MMAQEPSIPDRAKGQPDGGDLVALSPCWLPVAVRELRMAARRPWSYYTRCVAAGIVILLVCGILEGVLLGWIPGAVAGLTMFTLLSCLLFGFVSLEGAWTAADALSREKREDTLGLIFLTALSPAEIVFSKLVACGGGPLFSLLAVIPVPSLSFFLGGLSWGDYARMMLALANGLFVSLAAGLLVSACSRRERRAIAAALIAILSLSFIVPALGVLLWSLAEVRKSMPIACLAVPLLAFSPSTAVLSILSGTSLVPAQMAAMSTFGVSLLASHALGWCLLALATRVVRTTVQEEVMRQRPREEQTTGHSRRRVKAMRVDRRPLALRLAEWSVTPCYILYSGALLAVVAWGIGYALAGPKMVHWAMAAGTALFLHWCLKLDLAVQATRALREEKRTGALEILLTTPLDPREIVGGRLLALKRRFVAPTLALVALDFGAAWLLAVNTGSGSSSELIGLSVAVMVFVLFQLADMYTLSWWGLWLGYRHDEPGRALRQVLGTVVLGPFAILTVFLGTTVLFFGPAWVKTPPFAIFMASGWILSVWMTSFALCAKAMGGLRDQFREMLTNPG